MFLLEHFDVCKNMSQTTLHISIKRQWEVVEGRCMLQVGYYRDAVHQRKFKRFCFMVIKKKAIEAMTKSRSIKLVCK